MSIQIGKERKVTMHEFDVEMEPADHELLKRYALDHILSDDAALINYAFNGILLEQLRGKAKAVIAGAEKAAKKPRRKTRSKGLTAGQLTEGKVPKSKGTNGKGRVAWAQGLTADGH